MRRKSSSVNPRRFHSLRNMVGWTNILDSFSGITCLLKIVYYD